MDVVGVPGVRALVRWDVTPLSVGGQEVEEALGVCGEDSLEIDFRHPPTLRQEAFRSQDCRIPSTIILGEGAR